MPGSTRVPAQAPGSLELGLAGLLAGTALQIGQPQLWRQEAYALALGVAMALAVVLLVISFVLLAVINLLERWASRFER